MVEGSLDRFVAGIRIRSKLLLQLARRIKAFAAFGGALRAALTRPSSRSAKQGLPASGKLPLGSMDWARQPISIIKANRKCSANSIIKPDRKFQ